MSLFNEIKFSTTDYSHVMPEPCAEKKVELKEKLTKKAGDFIHFTSDFSNRTALVGFTKFRTSFVKCVENSKTQSCVKKLLKFLSLIVFLSKILFAVDSWVTELINGPQKSALN